MSSSESSNEDLDSSYESNFTIDSEHESSSDDLENIRGIEPYLFEPDKTDSDEEEK